MAPRNSLSEEDHITFLVSYIRNTLGTTDWEKIIQECGIVSVGAAKKRLSRLQLKTPAVTVAVTMPTGPVGEVDETSSTSGNNITPPSSSSKTPRKAGGRTTKVTPVKTTQKKFKDAIDAVIAPEPAGVTKKRAPRSKKKQQNGSTAVAAAAGLISADAIAKELGLKVEDDNDDEDGEGEEGEDFQAGFFNEQIARGVTGVDYEEETD